MLPLHSHSRFASLIAFGLLILVGIGAWAFIRFVQPQQVAVTPTPTPAATAAPTTTTVFYTEVVKTADDPVTGRGFPTYDIFMKAGAAGTPVKLATVGKVGERAQHFMVSKDRKSLFFSTEKALVSLDLASHDLTTVYTAKNQVSSYVFNQDGTEVLIWDETYAAESPTGYEFIRMELGAKYPNVISKGASFKDGFPFLSGWRADDIAILLIGKGEAAGLATINALTGKVDISTKYEANYGHLSQDGVYMASVTNVIEDICNDFSGSATATHTVFNTLTETKYGVIGSKDKIVNIVAFSPDDTLVLYSEAKPWTDKADCEKTPALTYYAADSDTGTKTVVVPDPDFVLNDWKLPSIASKDFVKSIDKVNVVASFAQ